MPRTVLVTGSSRGIGQAIAQKFYENNDHVILNCKTDIEAMENLVLSWQQTNPNILGIPCDVSKYEEVCKMFATIESRFGTVDVLVNNAGVSYIGLFNTMQPSDWQTILNTNLNSVINCTHVAIQSMIREKTNQSVILNISSIWGITGASCETIYSASKGAIDSFSKALAKELAPSGIRVNAIACGVVETEMNHFLTPDETEQLIQDIPLGRFAKPREIADLVFFLASEQAGYITGQVIPIDGALI